MNITLFALTALRSHSLTPFATIPISSHFRAFLATDLRMSHQFCPFLFTNRPNPSVTVARSEFGHFLRSCIVIENIDIPGASGQSTSGATVSENFNCINNIFRANKAQLFGGAICVTSITSVTGNIQKTTFQSNEATMGGAVYFCANTGKLTVESSRFESNRAISGAHMFLSKAGTMSFTDTDFLFAQGRSSIQFALSQMSPSLTNCRFFHDNASLLFMAKSKPTFTRCCFTNYGDGPSFTPINDRFFDTSYGAESTYTFTDCCVNFKTFTETSVANDQLTAKLAQLTGSDSSCDYCRLVPLPTATVNASWQMLAAKEAIIAICAFAVVSIIGIIFVACGCCQTTVNWDVTDESSSIDVPKE